MLNFEGNKKKLYVCMALIFLYFIDLCLPI